jgi:DNA-binding transcriptional regulator YiaG
MVSSGRKKTRSTKPEEVKNRGKRIKYLRKLLRYSARAFCEKCQAPESTLKSWEQGRFTGLTTDGALRIIAACEKEGLDCTLDWLLYGEGDAPQLKKPLFAGAFLPSSTVSPLTQELRLFHQLHTDVIDTIVNDEAMEPFFTKDDHVAGIRYFGDDIKKLLGLNCIMQLQSGEIIVRKLASVDKDGNYTLTSLNTKFNPNIIKNASIFSAAYIIWTRKPELKK